MIVPGEPGENCVEERLGVASMQVAPDQIADGTDLLGLLASLGHALEAVFVEVQQGVEPDCLPLVWVTDHTLGPGRQAEIVRLAHWELAHQRPARPVPVATYSYGDLALAAVGLHGSSLSTDVLVVGRPHGCRFGAWELETIRAFARVIPIAMQRAAPGSPLDELVAEIAALLMSTDSETLSVTLTELARMLAEFFEVSGAVIRRNEHERGLSVIAGVWPPQEPDSGPDPLAAVPFEGPDSDRVFAATRDLREPLIIHPDQQDEFPQRVRQAAGGPPVALLVVPIFRYGVTRGVVTLINSEDRTWRKAELNTLRAIASLLSQLGGRLDAEDLLRQRGDRDELTGLLNRRALIREMTARPGNGAAAQVVTACIDLDGLKALNDSAGQQTADAVLREFAERICAEVAPADTVARVGGGFAVVFGGVPEDPVAHVEKIISAATTEPLSRPGSNIAPLTACAGIAVSTTGAVGAEEMLRRAEIALFEAKASGPGKVLMSDQEMLISSARRTEIFSHLGSAVSAGELELYYLPELDLRSGALLAVEALVRWHHPTLGFLTPDSFIPLAEESPAIMRELGAWVLDRACSQLAAWRAEFPLIPLTVRVNVSPGELLIGHLPQTVGETLARHGLYGSDLCLEVTERTMLREMDRVLAALNEIRTMGVTIALDDFGTGYSTLSQLRQLPVDALKMDRQFIKDLASNKADMVIVESTVQLARNFGLEVVAEGVDSPFAAQELLRIGCYRVQGHLFLAAAPAPVIRDLVAGGGFDLAALSLGTRG